MPQLVLHVGEGRARHDQSRCEGMPYRVDGPTAQPAFFIRGKSIVSLYRIRYFIIFIDTGDPMIHAPTKVQLRKAVEVIRVAGPS